jgi:hypothetical protein
MKLSDEYLKGDAVFSGRHEISIAATPVLRQIEVPQTGETILQSYMKLSSPLPSPVFSTGYPWLQDDGSPLNFEIALFVDVTPYFISEYCRRSISQLQVATVFAVTGISVYSALRLIVYIFTKVSKKLLPEQSREKYVALNNSVAAESSDLDHM